MFNINVVHLPTKYIRYVVVHEVCHLKHKNHSDKFWAEVENFLPDYKQTKKELKKIVIN
jgi:predicted metal-dependent hydrolase